MALKNNTWKLNQWYDQAVAGNAEYAGLSQLWALGGENQNGQLGQNNTTKYSSPVQIPGSTWSQAEGVYYASAGVKTDGTLWAWGQNIYGTLGQNSETQYSSPVQIGSGTDWSQISVGQVNMIAIKTDGTMWSWGGNSRGGLGINQPGTGPGSRSSPTQVPGTTWSKVDTAFSRGFGIKTDGTLWSWGYGSYGYLGVNNNTQRSSPVQVPGTTWKDVDDGTYHVVATKTDGTLWTWGYQDKGELGHNSNVWRSSPVQVPGTNWAHAVAGYQASWAIKTDGTLWSWGQNASGTLGHNNRTNYSSPTQIPGTDWSTETGHMEADGNGNRTYLIKTDGTLWAMGYNAHGYLGLNNTVSYSSPVQVGSGTGWNKLGSSDQGTLASILQ